MMIYRLFLSLSLVQWQCAALLSNNNNNNDGLAGKWQEVLSKVSGKPPRAPTPEEQRDMVLQRLNLTSSIEPKRFSVEPSAIPAILGTTIPVSGASHRRAIPSFDGTVVLTLSNELLHWFVI